MIVALLHKPALFTICSLDSRTVASIFLSLTKGRLAPQVLRGELHRVRRVALLEQVRDQVRHYISNIIK